MFASVCSGIEAPSVAWHPLGWEASFYAEIDRFPSAVLNHHYPAVPNLGDMTRFHDWPDAAFDVLVGGTPCQSFSVAGLRAGLADPRGNLALVFLAIADRFRPQWVVWENVPGVLSSAGGRDFGSFLGGLGQLGYGWAYRVLDAQYFGVPQRRRRVFVVGNLGGWQRAAAILFERSSLQGNPAPSREPGEGTTPILEAGARTGKSTSDPRAGIGIGEPGDPMFTLQSGKQHAIAPTLLASAGRSRGAGTPVSLLAPEISRCVSTGEGNRQDWESTTLVAHSLRADGFDASEDGTGRGTPLIPVAFDARQSDVIQYGDKAGPLDTDGFSMAVAFDTTQVTSAANYSNPKPGDPCHPLAAGMHPPAVAFTSKDHGADAGDLAPTLRAMGHAGSHANAGGQVAVAFTVSDKSNGFAWEREISPTLDATAGKMSNQQYGVRSGMQVRRLTPRECERLQGFPDDYTLIPVKGKPAADGPRYKALGNSMAVPVVRWLGERIQTVQELA